MAPEDTPEDKSRKPETETEEHEPHKHRRHGYRGYPNNPDIGGDIHTGTGFAGVGPGGATGNPRKSSFFPDKTQESVEELADEEEEKKEKE